MTLNLNHPRNVGDIGKFGGIGLSFVKGFLKAYWFFEIWNLKFTCLNQVFWIANSLWLYFSVVNTPIKANFLGIPELYSLCSAFLHSLCEYKLPNLTPKTNPNKSFRKNEWFFDIFGKTAKKKSFFLHWFSINV